MKKTLFLVIFMFLPAFAAQFPARPQGPIGDYAGVLDATTIAAVTQISQSLWEQAGFALVIATTTSIGDESIEDYAVALYKNWGVGVKMKEFSLYCRLTRGV